MVKYFDVTRTTDCDEYDPFPKGKTCGPSDKDLSKVSEYPVITVKAAYVGKELEILDEFTQKGTVFYDAMPVLKKTLKPTTRFSKNDGGPCHLSSMSCDNDLIDWWGIFLLRRVFGKVFHGGVVRAVWEFGFMGD